MTSNFAEPTQVKHALFVAFHYPPEASSSGVLRTLKYTRYLADYGWRTSVITPAVDAYTTVDPALAAQIPATTRVIRTRYLNTKKHLSVRGVYLALMALPDAWVGWAPWAVAAGRRLMTEDPFDLVYSTSPHATAHLIAWRVATSGRRPWVTDFRDPWVEEPPEPGAPRGLLYTYLNRWLERTVIERCNAVVTSTTQLRDLLRERYPSQGTTKISAIQNGYDEADFTTLPSPHRGANDHMTLLHAGGINPTFRNPRPLFAALRSSAGSGEVDLARIKVRFLGGGAYAESPEFAREIGELGLSEVVEILPRIPYAQSLEQLLGADVLVLLQASPDTVGLVPAKLYEYLRAGKPVLAVVPRGATSDVVDSTRGGWSVAPDDSARLQRCLALAYQQWLTGALVEMQPDPIALQRYERRSLAGELARVFERVVAEKG